MMWPMELETVGNGTPVVLIGGGNSGLRSFAGQLALAERGYQLLAPAPRTALPASLDFEQDAAALDELLPEESAHLVGHSYGGLTAMYLAARRPTGVRSLLLIEPAAMSIARGVPAVEKHVGAVSRVFDQVGTLSIEEFDAAMADALRFPRREPDSLTEADRFRVELLRRQRLPWTADLPVEALAMGRYPKLIVSSGSEPMYEAVADRLAKAVGATRTVVPDARHRVQDARKFNAVVEQLFTGA
jgi:pimeloyl-ACP methyl ester carboxylesterase